MSAAAVTNPEPANTVELGGPVVDRLLDLVFGGFSVPEPSFAQIVDGDWAGFSFAGRNGRLGRDGDRLKVLIDVDAEESLRFMTNLMRIRNQAACVTLADDSTVTAKYAHMPRVGGQAEINLHHWLWRTSRRPLYWMGRLQGRLSSHGNTVLVESRGRQCRSRKAFRLEGRFVWYIAPTDETSEYVVVVDPRGCLPNRDALLSEVFSLEFAYGTALRIDHLVGIDADGIPAAATSVGNLVRPGSARRPPVPDSLEDAEVWAPEFFRLVAAKLSEEGLEPLMLAIGPYLDSESDHLDGAYLKAQVGLEAFAKRLVGRGKPDLLVKTATDWRKWVSTLKSSIVQHVINRESVDKIYGKFVAAMYAPTGELVDRAFRAHQITIPPELVEEIGKRNYPAHGFLMNKSLDHDVDRDTRRLEMIQTLLAALAACHVGYWGPLRGYDPSSNGDRRSPAWWPMSQKLEDTWVRYEANRNLPEIDDS